MKPLTTTINEDFELERFNRVLDGATDRESLRRIAKQLLQAWITQKAATRWALQQSLPARPRITPPSDLSPNA